MLDSKVVLHSVGLSKGASRKERVSRKVDSLADLTGGSIVHYSDGGSPAGLIDAFISLASSALDGKIIYALTDTCSMA